MQYELYLDVFFLENFMMDFLLLMLLRRILAPDSRAFSVRITLGAALGAAMTCAVVILPIPYAFIKILLFHGVISILMLKTGLGVGWGRELIKAVLFLYIGAFLIGGIMSFLRQYLRGISLFFVLSLLGYYLASGVWSLIESLVRDKESHCTVILYNRGRSCRKKALIDTGNRLRDDITGRPVSIVGPGTAKLLGIAVREEIPEKIRYVSYHSIGKEAGVLPIFEIDKMYLIADKKKTELLRPLLAVCEGEMDFDDYGMILNPDIYFGGSK